MLYMDGVCLNTEKAPNLSGFLTGWGLVFSFHAHIIGWRPLAKQLHHHEFYVYRTRAALFPSLHGVDRGGDARRKLRLRQPGGVKAGHAGTRVERPKIALLAGRGFVPGIFYLRFRVKDELPHGLFGVVRQPPVGAYNGADGRVGAHVNLVED